ncbi:MAG: hypothetical protein GXC73_19995 [Chitinophagaceae bacterium]|nr:hypothetical protein [Chitinophagaceae bacterium]
MNDDLLACEQELGYVYYPYLVLIHKSCFEMRISHIIALTVGIILIFSLPFILKSSLFEFDKDIDANRFSQYGSYIGGLLGASFAGLSFFILVLTYRAQIEDGKRNRQNENLNHIYSLYNSVLSEIDSLSHKNAKGVEVFYVIDSESIKKPQGILDQLNSILVSFDNLIKLANNTEYISDEIKELTLTRIHFQYYSKIIWPVNAKIGSEIRKELSATHDNAKYYFECYDRLSVQTIKYLNGRSLTSDNLRDAIKVKQA